MSNELSVPSKDDIPTRKKFFLNAEITAFTALSNNSKFHLLRPPLKSVEAGLRKTRDTLHWYCPFDAARVILSRTTSMAAFHGSSVSMTLQSFCFDARCLA